MEQWNNGILEYWNYGIMVLGEWIIGILAKILIDREANKWKISF
jgi:hypothetical protein